MASVTDTWHKITKALTRLVLISKRYPLVFLVLVPALIYFVFFCIYSWPWMANFSTNFFTDQGDGFQNVWNMWWVNEAVTNLQASPWHTNLLHHPYGVTLLGQTLNPFNGFVGVLLQTVFSLVQAYNIMVIFSFVFGGMTMFWLCYFFTRRYIPSLLGGFLFTFSSYHFAHAIGHMQLVSLEWLPLFILFWWLLLTRPRFRWAIGAALTLLLVLWCDYYYFLYAAATAVAILVYLWRKKKLAPLKDRQVQWRFGLCVALGALLVAPLPLALMLTNVHDPMGGSHPSRVYSTDLFSPFIDGGFWRFGWLTDAYWHRIPAYVAESSVYLGLSVLVVFVIALLKRKKIHTDIVFWIGVALVFGIFSLGPRLMVAGHSFEHGYMPYALLEMAIPALKLSGMPVRMMVMVIFAASIIVAMVLSRLNLRQTKGKLLMGLFVVVLIIELWPAALPVNTPTHGKYLDVLKQLPSGAVIDNAAVSSSWQLYGQTIHHKPSALGYISRTPTSVEAKDIQFIQAMDGADYRTLCTTFKLRYITLPPERPIADPLVKAVYQDKQAIIYDLSSYPGCKL